MITKEQAEYLISKLKSPEPFLSTHSVITTINAAAGIFPEADGYTMTNEEFMAGEPW